VQLTDRKAITNRTSIRRPGDARAGVVLDGVLAVCGYCTVKFVVALPEIPLMVPVAFTW
jgi:hypothetical protein